MYPLTIGLEVWPFNLLIICKQIMQFGLMIFFLPAFPLAAVFSLLNNMIEVRSDAFKMCLLFQRPFGQRKYRQLAKGARSFFNSWNHCQLWSFGDVWYHTQAISFAEFLQQFNSDRCYRGNVEVFASVLAFHGK